MITMETTEEYFARIGSREAMEKRQTERLAGKLNKQLPRGRPSTHGGTVGHPWECECELCRPWLWSDGEKIDTDRDKPTGNWHEKLPDAPVVVPATAGAKKKASKWQSRGRSSN